MRVQARCAERVNSTTGFHNHGSFLSSPAWVCDKKRDAVDLQTPPPPPPAVLMSLVCVAPLERFGRNGLTADRERDARPQFLLCGTRIRQVPQHPSSGERSFNFTLFAHRSANDLKEKKKVARDCFKFLIKFFFFFFCRDDSGLLAFFIPRIKTSRRTVAHSTAACVRLGTHRGARGVDPPTRGAVESTHSCRPRLGTAPVCTLGTMLCAQAIGARRTHAH